MYQIETTECKKLSRREIVETLLQNKSRFIPDYTLLSSETNLNFDSLLWHLALYKNFSKEDCNMIQSFIPKHCSLFIKSENSFLFRSGSFDAINDSLKSEIQYAYDATYAQQIMTAENGLMRVLTVPFTENILIGLVSPSGLFQTSEIEDIFLHKLHVARNRYNEILRAVTEMQKITKHTDPIIIINRSDNQLLTCNITALTFFNLSQKSLLDTNLQNLHKNYPKASKRKIHIRNCVVGNTDCSLVQFTLKNSDSFHVETITQELQTHADYLFQFYKEIQKDNNIKSDSFDASFIELERCCLEIKKLRSKEEK